MLPVNLLLELAQSGMSEGTYYAIDLQLKLSLPKQSARPRYHVLCQPRNICLLLIAAVSHFRRVGSEQPPVKCAARAGQRWPGLSDHSGEGKSGSGSRTPAWGSHQSRWVASDQSEGGIVTHWPIRVTEIVLLNSSLFFLLSPFSLSHPGHWNNIEQEWRRPEKIFCRWYMRLISDFNWITLFWF